MGRRVHSTEFKREAAKLALQQGKSKVQVAGDLGVHINVLRHWVKQFQAGVWGATPGKSLKGEQLEIERLRRQLKQAETERDILKKAVAYFAKNPSEVRLCCAAPIDLAGKNDVPDAGGVAWRVL